jgi:hypothetical protein
MELNKAIESLKSDILSIYSQTKNSLKPNIYRGHSRSISADIEDCVTVFISNILPSEYKFFIDASVRLNGRSKRPDLLIVDQNNKVYAMVEIKANMGYCREASNEINKIIDNHNSSIELSNLVCKFSDRDEEEVEYSKDVKLFLISLTDSNNSSRNHSNNKIYATSKSVHHYNLFSGWYDSLTNNEIMDFVHEISVESID